MFMLAGLIGAVVSGALVFGPSMMGRAEDDADAIDAEEAADAEEARDDGTAPDILSDEAQGGGPQPATEGPDLTDDPAAEADAPDDGPDQAPARDLLAGEYTSDAMGGSDASPIHYDDDALFGSSGDDDLSAEGRLVVAGDGDDAVRGGADRDELVGGRGDDTLRGDDGDDILWGDAGDDMIDGEAGDDMLVGGDGDDLVTGGDGDDRLFGQDGADTLLGGAGNDILDGSEVEPGRRDQGDVLDGGEGDDTLAGAAGDTLTGGEGSDKFLFKAPSAAAFSTAEDVPVVTDFDPELDWLEVIVDGEVSSTDAVEVVPGDGASDITVNGAIVARISGDVEIPADRILLLSGW